MSTALKHRVSLLEAQLMTNSGWWNMEEWLEAHAMGLSIDEQERRKLDRYPHAADEIRAHFQRVRRNLERAGVCSNEQG